MPLIERITRARAYVPQAVMDMIKGGGTFIPILPLLWTATNVGSGGGSLQDTLIPCTTGVTANSSALKTLRLWGLGTNATDGSSINWAKKIIFHLPFQRDISDAESVFRIQIKAASTIGALGDKGFGLQGDNLALTAESYGTSLATIDLATTLTLTKLYRLTIIHDPGVPKIEWYIDKTLKDTQSTAAKQPTTTSSTGYIALSNANGATGGANAQLLVCEGWIWQAF